MEAMKREMETSIADQLPKECISNVLSFTSPRDACRSSLVSRVFLLAAGSDFVWDRFLPPDYRQIIFQSELPPSSPLNALPKKELYFRLCHNPILIGNGNRSFAIEKSSGKKCFMLGARELNIIWGNDPMYWRWISSSMLPSLPKSRFLELAHLLRVCWLEIRGRIETRVLSPNTRYGAYFIYAIENESCGLSSPIKVSANLKNENKGNPTIAYLRPGTAEGKNGQLPHRREDAWLEIELGEFFNSEVDSLVHMCLRENQELNRKSGLVVHGIEVRPK